MVKWLITKIIFKIHPLFYLVALVCFLTGWFKNFVIFSSIICVHELGHFFFAICFKWRIEKILLLPFGGITIFNEKIDKPLLEEFFIALGGPIFQFIYFCIFKDNTVFFTYNMAILIFNLLPIYPLDGSRILNIFFNILIPFKMSHLLSIIISYISFSLLFIYFLLERNILFLFIILFVLLEIFKETIKHNYYFSRFLLERYMYNCIFKKEKVINHISKMKKQTRHIFNIGNNYYTEREIIRKLFDK